MASPHKKAYILLAVGIAILGLVLSLMVIGYGRLKAAQKRMEEARDPSKLQVLAAVDPCADLARLVGGDFVQVSVLTPAGKSPETFAPTPARLEAVAGSQIVLLTGTPVEERFLDNMRDRASDAAIVDLRDGVELMADQHHHHHDGDEEDDDHDHDHEAALGGLHSIDPHLWTSPGVARQMASTMAASFAKADPDHAEEYHANAARLDADLAALQREIALALAPYEGRDFYVFHPAYGYYAREFGLEQRAIEVNGKSPKPRELSALIKDAKSSDISVLIVQPEFNRVAAQVVADAVGAELVDHSPLEAGYFDNVRKLTNAILRSFNADPLPEAQTSVADAAEEAEETEQSDAPSDAANKAASTASDAE